MDYPYNYTEVETHKLIQCLSTERFQKYLDARSGDEIAALQLYLWNISVAATFHGPLHILEITLRNAIHTRMSDRYGASWFDLGHLGGPELGSIQEARAFLSMRGDVSPGKIVAEVNFRFWVGLFSSRYHALWKSDLGRLFTPRIDHSIVHDELDRLRTLRNRIAHHEPIFNRRLLDDLNRIYRLVHSLSPDMEDWMRWHQRADVAIGTATTAVCAF